ncbi:hypothetical protein [Providencia rettgeri]|uniref:hypothetical protein n=1 Tax=Providencia rettgeri TaxID=587 RepID=UPI00244C9BD0|nr:hypothetical protein [Providencia rettgeri]MDH2364852.1 hypothetical protein [Providencia rettgeri]HEM7186670.1 hypothetical protein [Providencia rettgeri]
MDYYLTKSDRGGVVILHKKACPKLTQHSNATYVGYYFGEYGALQKVESMTTSTVRICSECMTDVQAENSVFEKKR